MTKKIFAALAICLALAPAAAADPFNVKVDQTVPLKLNQPANSVIVGNATVADVTVHDARTLLVSGKDHRSGFLVEGALQPEEVAECVVQGLDKEEFLILPHPEVLGYMQGKTANYDRWLGGMRKARARAQQK